MSRRKFHRHRILDFAVSEYTMKKLFAEAIERVLDPFAFDKINADADDAHLRAAPAVL
jgi:hypothetical protein